MKNLSYIHEVIEIKVHTLDIYTTSKPPSLREIHFDAKYIVHQDEMHGSGVDCSFYSFIGVGVKGDRSQTKAQRKLCEHDYRKYTRSLEQHSPIQTEDDRMADDGPYGRII